MATIVHGHGKLSFDLGDQGMRTANLGRLETMVETAHGETKWIRL
jgi:hypothetical protein